MDLLTLDYIKKLCYQYKNKIELVSIQKSSFKKNLYLHGRYFDLKLNCLRFYIEYCN